MKLIATVTTTIEMEYPDSPDGRPYPQAYRENVTSAYEAGYRVGLAKDVDTTNQVMRQQFGVRTAAAVTNLAFAFQWVERVRK